MTSLALGAVERVFKAGLAIKKAAQTARRNKECRDIERCVARIGALLVLLNDRTGLMRHPAISGPLEDLAESLEEALELITECQEETNAVRRLLTAGDMAKQLRQVQDDILRKLTLGNFAYNVQITITLTNTIRSVGGAQLQGAGEVEISCCSHSNAGVARSVEDVDEIITTVTTETEASCAASSSVTEFSLSETVATHHVSEDINGGSGYTVVTKTKIVLKVAVTCNQCKACVLSILAKMGGMRSLCFDEDKSTLELVGRDLDPVAILSCLRKAKHSAVILTVEEPMMVSAQEAQQEPATRWPRARIRAGVRAITDKLSRFLRPRARRSSPPPTPSPLRARDTDALALAAATSREAPASTHAPQCELHRRAMAEHLSGTPPGPLLLQHQSEAPPSATAAAPWRRTFNMSKLRRRGRLPAVRQLRLKLKQQRARLDGSSPRSSRARALPLFVSCALCAILLLASLWALR